MDTDRTDLLPEWDDRACLGTYDAFEAWLETRGLTRFAEHRDPLGYESWLAYRLENGVGCEQEQRAATTYLRASGWAMVDGEWQFMRPAPLAVAGELEARGNADAAGSVGRA
jgi:hypothetical protein